MQLAKRIFLFLLTNLLVILTISITLQVLGVRPYLGQYGIEYSALFIFSFIWGMGGAFISLAMSRASAKWFLGVKVIAENTNDEKERRLLNLVANLAQQAGIIRPEVGIYAAGEVNALATGPSKQRSLLAVSTALLYHLNEKELKGVLGHELAHIANGDMVTMTLIQGVINAFVIFFARAIAWTIAQRFDDAKYLINFVVTIILEIALSLFGWLVVARFSRQREFRADAGSARIAGKSNMIAALEKLKHTEKFLKKEKNQSLATLKITSRPSGFTQLWATHPPLDERIKMLKSN